MRNDLKHKLLYVLLIIFIFSASGCNFAPKEEALPDAPLIPTGNVQQYKKVEVLRGDIIDRATIRCTYKAFKTESLKFNTNGLLINHIYVQIGDYVKAGDILADLEMGDFEKQITYKTSNIELLGMKRKNEMELKNLAISSWDKLKGTVGFNNQIDKKYQSEIEGLEDSITGLTNDLFIEQERLKLLFEEVSKRRIIAGIDGIVSNITSYDKWYVSHTNDKLITLYDPATMVFTTDGKHSDLFESGQQVNITVDDIAYKAVVVSPIEHDDQIKSSQAEGVVYLKVEDKQGLLQENDIGEVTFIIKVLKDVLYLPSSAVHKENNKMYVFVEDEGGFKSVKDIETGLSLDRKVEINSGLSEGDIVILD